MQRTIARTQQLEHQVPLVPHCRKSRTARTACRIQLAGWASLVLCSPQ